MRRSSATGYTPGSSPAIARAIGHLDIGGHQLSILDLIAKLNRKTGMTIIAVFHELNLAAGYCQRLLVLDRGRVRHASRSLDCRNNPHGPRRGRAS